MKISFDGFLGEYWLDEADFKGHPVISPTGRGIEEPLTVVVDDSHTNKVVIGWQHAYFDDKPPYVTVTLYADGTIRFSYGDRATSLWSEVAGISAGDGVRFECPEELLHIDDLAGAQDVVFSPRPFIPGLALSSDGTVSGTPTQAGTFQIPVSVRDDEGATWSGTLRLVVLPDAHYTKTTPEPVPHAWLGEAAVALLAAHGGDYEATANATAANGVNKVWECYVAGISPTNSLEALRAIITMDANGNPVVSWTPDLNEGGTKHERVYTVEGMENLTDKSWGPTNSASRFFRVKVEMP